MNVLNATFRRGFLLEYVTALILTKMQSREHLFTCKGGFYFKENDNTSKFAKHVSTERGF